MHCLCWLQSSSAAECLRKSRKTRACDSSRHQADQHRAFRGTQGPGTGLRQQGRGLGQEDDPGSVASSPDCRRLAVRRIPLPQGASCRKRATSSATPGGVPQQEAQLCVTTSWTYSDDVSNRWQSTPQVAGLASLVRTWGPRTYRAKDPQCPCLRIVESRTSTTPLTSSCPVGSSEGFSRR